MEFRRLILQVFIFPAIGGMNFWIMVRRWPRIPNRRPCNSRSNQAGQTAANYPMHLILSVPQSNPIAAPCRNSVKRAALVPPLPPCRFKMLFVSTRHGRLSLTAFARATAKQQPLKLSFPRGEDHLSRHLQNLPNSESGECFHAVLCPQSRTDCRCARCLPACGAPSRSSARWFLGAHNPATPCQEQTRA
jgi:hypothetical protein